MSLVYTKYKKIAFIFICITIIILILYASYLGMDVYIKEVYHYSLAPLQAALHKTFQYTVVLRQNAQQIRLLKTQLQQTQFELLKYQNLLSAFQSNEQNETTNLQELLHQTDSLYKNDFISSMVIAKDPQNLFNTLIVNVGKKVGVQQNMPVVSLAENTLVLVGYVYAAGPYSATIRTILDHRCHVSVLIQDLRSIAVMKGQTSIIHNTLVDYIDINLENLEGKSIVTSGLGEKYPKEILIGTIIQTSKKSYGFFQQATVKPIINFFTIEHVLIIPYSAPLQK